MAVRKSGFLPPPNTLQLNFKGQFGGICMVFLNFYKLKAKRCSLHNVGLGYCKALLCKHVGGDVMLFSLV